MPSMSRTVLLLPGNAARDRERCEDQEDAEASGRARRVQGENRAGSGGAARGGAAGGGGSSVSTAPGRRRPGHAPAPLQPPRGAPLRLRYSALLRVRAHQRTLSPTRARVRKTAREGYKDHVLKKVLKRMRNW